MMKRIASLPTYGLVLVIAATLAAGPVLADKPAWAGGGDKQEKKGKGHRDKGGDHDRGGRGGDHFTDRHRVVIHEYYAGEFRGGRCPPGLAKKNNGCMPPGQAKKWAVGRPLPPEVVYYDLPPALVVKIGAPPAGHRYVRVAADILLIAVGTGMVVSAIQDLGRM
jgi:Ni/Co efflux regulator RcnB